MIVPAGVLVAAILVIAGGYVIFNDSSGGSGGLNSGSGSGSGDYVEPSESYAQDFMPEINVKSDELTRNAPVPFTVGDKYRYQTTMQSTYSQYSPDDYEEVGEVIVNPQTGKPERVTTTRPREGAVEVNETHTETMETGFSVDKIERFEGRDCYVISSKIKREISGEEKADMRKYMSDAEVERQIEEMEEMMEQQKTLFYYDRDTGKTMQVKMNMGGANMTFTEGMAEFFADTGIGGLMGGGSMFAGWMLALDKDFTWKQEIEIMEKLGSGSTTGGTATITYKVIDVEKANGRDCFKVEVEGTFKEDVNNKNNYDTPGDKLEMLVWVDVDKRISVKQQIKSGNFMSTETNLVEGI